MLILARKKSLPVPRAKSNALAKEHKCAGGPVDAPGGISVLQETGVEPPCQWVLPVTGSGAGEGPGWHGGANPQGSPEHHV